MLPASVGLVLALMLAAWALLSTPHAPRAAATSATVVLGIIVWVLAAKLSQWRSAVPGMAVAGVVVVLMVLSLPESLSRDVSAGPLGYGNANAAILTAGVAGLVHSATQVTRPTRLILLSIAGVLTAAAILTEARATAYTCLFMLSISAFAGRGRRIAWQLGSAAVVFVALSVVILLGLSHRSGTTLAHRLMDPARTALWSEALDMAGQEPIRGVGPGGFAEQSAIAAQNPRLRWVHSEPLQVAAELGWVGLALLAMLAIWMLAVLGRGAYLFAALALQPMIDYTLHFPVVVAASAAVLGAAYATNHPRYLTAGLGAASVRQPRLAKLRRGQGTA